MASDADPPGRRPEDSIGYLLAKIGASSAREYATRVAPLDLVPAHAGLLRLVPAMPGASQQDLAKALAVPPSRMVALIDDLEERGLLARRRSPDDRRVHTLELTEAGRVLGGQLAEIGSEHERAITQGLSDGERDALLALLQRIARSVELQDAWAEPGAPPRARSPQ